MKFNQYLTEGFDKKTPYKDDEIFDILKRDCRPYISMLEKNNIKKPFERGVYGERIDGYLAIKTVRQDRNAKGNAHGTAPAFNNWLGSNGHNQRDKSISIISHAPDVFGRVFYVFPIGKFNYTFIKQCNDINIANGIWSPIILEIAFDKPDTDLLSFIKDYIDDKRTNFDGMNFDTKRANEIMKWQPEDAINYLKKNTVTNKNIKMAYDDKLEIWINPKKYYLVEKYLIDSFKNKDKLFK